MFRARSGKARARAQDSEVMIIRLRARTNGCAVHVVLEQNETIDS
jgi:hypothetical protein